MGAILPIRGGLGFPGRKPGFDPRHIASRGIGKGRGLSAVASGSSFVNLLSGAVATGTVNGAAVGQIGPAVNIGSSGGSNNLVFGGQSTASDTSGTLAAIIFPTSWPVSGDASILSTSDQHVSNNGLCLQYDTAATPGLSLTLGGVANNYLGLLVATGYPNFVAASYNPTQGTVAIAMNLASGFIATATAAAVGTPLASNGSYEIGNGFGSTRAFIGLIGAVMYAPTFMSLATMKAWAADPWAFWYPQTDLALYTGKTSAAVPYFGLPRSNIITKRVA